MAFIADDAAEAGAAKLTTRTGQKAAENAATKKPPKRNNRVRLDTAAGAVGYSSQQGTSVSVNAKPKGRHSKVIAGAWFVGICFITYQEVHTNHAAPEPKRFVGWSVAQGILALLYPLIDDVATVISVGLFIGMVMFRKPSTPEFANPKIPTPTSYGATGGVPQGVSFGGAQAAQSQAGTVSPPYSFGGATATGSQSGIGAAGVVNG